MSIGVVGTTASKQLAGRPKIPPCYNSGTWPEGIWDGIYWIDRRLGAPSWEDDGEVDVHVRGKNMTITDALRDHVEKKLGKLARHFGHDPVVADAVLSVEKDRQMVEVTVPVEGGRILRGQESTPDMYTSVDLVVQKLERQLDKLKAHNKARHPHVAAEAHHNVAEDSLESAIVRRKTFPVKPMSLDEAILQMDLVSHDFFAFMNAETERINVLYRRRDGNLGLLEPN